jgi:peptide-methionine (R)-S-oxide reductase
MERAMYIQTIIFAFCIAASAASCGQLPVKQAQEDSINWDQELTSEEYRILRQCGTEAPFTGEFWDHHEDGVYACAGCKHPLFDSSTKFESGSGWPSFFDVIDNSSIDTKEDLKYGMKRIELLCHQCQGHLGHVFSDGPPPHGLRYCINSVSLDFSQRDSLTP